MHEIDLEINDIKTYLQDFFASMQGLKSHNEISDELALESIGKAYEALLEYRYIFSKFFHQFRLDRPEERSIRKQFLFVDQYFEAIENRLEDISSNG